MCICVLNLFEDYMRLIRSIPNYILYTFAGVMRLLQFLSNEE